MRANLTKCPAKVSPKREDAPQQAGVANSAWTVQASVAMVGHVLSETAVRVSIADVVIFRKENYEQGI
jgi:hypothetical protein